MFFPGLLTNSLRYVFFPTIHILGVFWFVLVLFVRFILFPKQTKKGTKNIIINCVFLVGLIMEMALIASFCTDCDTKQKSKNSQNIYIEFSFFLVILIA